MRKFHKQVVRPGLPCLFLLLGLMMWFAAANYNGTRPLPPAHPHGITR